MSPPSTEKSRLPQWAITNVPLHRNLLRFVIIPFLAFHSLIALLSETERYPLSRTIIELAGWQYFGGAMALCILGDIITLCWLSERLQRRPTFLDVALMLLCGVLAGLTLRGLYLATV
jgi:hypothetical protein